MQRYPDLAFQCSSASRKFLNLPLPHCLSLIAVAFQCSSASRKFLNRYGFLVASGAFWGFSALQRAENSSIRRCGRKRRNWNAFQCSSASRKFLNRDYDYDTDAADVVSVLFSEPKIPQFQSDAAATTRVRRFQCSSASRKFLNNDVL